MMKQNLFTKIPLLETCTTKLNIQFIFGAYTQSVYVLLTLFDELVEFRTVLKGRHMEMKYMSSGQLHIRDVYISPTLLFDQVGWFLHGKKYGFFRFTAAGPRWAHNIFLPGVGDGLIGLYHEIEVVYRDKNGKSISSR